ELDYALLRVRGQPGHEVLDAQRTRGWVRLPAEPYAFPPGSPILIVQHPRGDRLRLAIATDGIIAVNSTRTRVTYRTNTLGGSSGSPCFNQDWTPVALHHSGDSGFSAHYNEGIPLSTIRAQVPEAVRGQLGWA
ncbi:MAG TPA: serine protease, partial [Archangium sp.]|uniref:trypsin-like serine peptidase n=1 Tax=Archangium sp. TaxID=1872627 RepID=UPI002EDB4EB3